MSVLSTFLKREPLPLIYPLIQSGENTYTNVLLIDHSVPDYQTFVDSANSSTFPIVYSTTSSKRELLDLLQTNFTSISRIGIAFTSSLENTKMFLDNKPLFKEEGKVEPFSENVQFLIDVIKKFQVTNIDFLACNTLNYPTWTSYYNILTQNTGVIVGASDDKTGNIKYGGDWTMESTGQDVELVYFTKSIEYYSYLLDILAWANLPAGSNPYGVAIDSINGFMYVANLGGNTISKIVISTGAVTTLSLTGSSALSDPAGIAIDKLTGFMYVTNLNNTISQIVISSGGNTGVISNFVLTGPSAALSDPYGIAIDSNNEFMYVANLSGNTISKIVISSGLVTTFVSTGLNGPLGIAIDSNNKFMYVANFFGNTISKIVILTPAVVTTFATGFINPFGIAIDSTNKYMYVSNRSGNTISQIVIASQVVTLFVPRSFGLSNPFGLAIDSTNTFMYVANNGNSTISQITLPVLPPVPCFKEDSKILTDKGYILIQDLRKGDLVKTLLHDYKPIDMIGKRDIYHPASKERIKDQLYKCSQTEYPEIFEPLILTGCHSILVDGFTSEEQREKVLEVNGDIFGTDNKYRLPACADEKASVYEIPGSYTIYHLALEHDNYYSNYGIYANGLLVETCSKRYLKELSNMLLID